jgi:signal transduction histidine kinase
MKSSRLLRIVRSVFTKIFLVLLIAGLSINILVAAFSFHVIKDSVKGAWQSKISQYLDYIIKDLGEPPSLERAKQIAAESSVQIRYESPGVTWTTSDDIPPGDKLNSPGNQRTRAMGRYFARGRHIIPVSRGSGVYIFSFNPEFSPANGKGALASLLILALTLVIGCAYFAIRRILKPVKHLSEGVRQITDGRLDYQVPTGRITEFSRLAQAFNAMTLRIRNMLVAKDQLLLDVSHELRSPLTRMKVALELLPEGPARENLGDDIREMETMITGILETARIKNAGEGPRIEAIPARSFLAEIATLYRNMPPGVRIDPIDDNLSIDGDPVLVRIVFNNIITNAVKYSPSHGEPVRILWREDPEYVVFQVRDQGIGIPSTELPYIFEPFYRVDKSRSKGTGGYGLGLSLCKAIMEAHKGRIEVESAPGKGVTVTLSFPITR